MTDRAKLSKEQLIRKAWEKIADQHNSFGLDNFCCSWTAFEHTITELVGSLATPGRYDSHDWTKCERVRCHTEEVCTRPQACAVPAAPLGSDTSGGAPCEHEWVNGDHPPEIIGVDVCKKCHAMKARWPNEEAPNPPASAVEEVERRFKVCDECGGRASACKVLGHRKGGDQPDWTNYNDIYLSALDLARRLEEAFLTIDTAAHEHVQLVLRAEELQRTNIHLAEAYEACAQRLERSEQRVRELEGK